MLALGDGKRGICDGADRAFISLLQHLGRHFISGKLKQNYKFGPPPVIYPRAQDGTRAPRGGCVLPRTVHFKRRQNRGAREALQLPERVSMFAHVSTFARGRR